jgi:hypothetical protein
MAEKTHGAKIKAGIEKAKKRSNPTEEDEGGSAKKARKYKSVYLVNPRKFDSVASAEERALEFCLEDLSLEDTHRILQSKIRLVQ